MPNNVFVAEFLRYRRLAEGALEQVPDDALRRPLGAESHSIAILVGHLSGNLRSRFTDFLTSDGEKPWRQRDSEFADPNLNRAELIESWDSAWEILLEQVGELSGDDLERPVTIRGQQLSVGAALARSSCHLAYHVGQIITLARHWTGSEWKPLSIPPGKSDEYNRNPTLE